MKLFVERYITRNEKGTFDAAFLLFQLSQKKIDWRKNPSEKTDISTRNVLYKSLNTSLNKFLNMLKFCRNDQREEKNIRRTKGASLFGLVMRDILHFLGMKNNQLVPSLSVICSLLHRKASNRRVPPSFRNLIIECTDLLLYSFRTL